MPADILLPWWNYIPLFIFKLCKLFMNVCFRVLAKDVEVLWIYSASAAKAWCAKTKDAMVVLWRCSTATLEANPIVILRFKSVLKDAVQKNECYFLVEMFKKSLLRYYIFIYILRIDCTIRYGSLIKWYKYKIEHMEYWLLFWYYLFKNPYYSFSITHIKESWDENVSLNKLPSTSCYKR